MITTNGSYLPTAADFITHWGQCNSALPVPTPLIVRLEKNVAVSKLQFTGTRDALQTQQITVQARLTDQSIARGALNIEKANLLERLNQFIARLEAYYRGTRFYDARPYAPSITDGRDAFMQPLFDAMTLWEKLNTGAAPAGVTLPVVLPKTPTQPVTMDQGAFASAVSALCFLYNDERSKGQDVTLARSDRNKLQDQLYAVMKAYRQTVDDIMKDFPSLVETLPRLTPLPGHTPQPVNASAIFEAPDQSKVVYEASTESTLEKYELRGNVGDDYSDEDAFVIATNLPGAPREFVTPFGLNQPGAKVALKVYVILTTGNEAGSAVMLVQRPASVQLAA